MKKFTIGRVTSGLLVLVVVGCSGWLCHRFVVTNGPTTMDIVDSSGLKVDQFEVLYHVWESNRNSKKLCSLTMSQVTFTNHKAVNFILPAGITLQGKSLSNLKSSFPGGGTPIFPTFPCQDHLEFVITDDRGGKRVDKYNLRRAKFASDKKLSTNRSNDLQIMFDGVSGKDLKKIEVKITDAEKISYRFDVEPDDKYFSLYTKETHDSQEYLSILDENNKRINGQLIDLSTKTLLIPWQLLKYLKGKTAMIELEITDSSLKSSNGNLDYSYFMPPLTLKLK